MGFDFCEMFWGGCWKKKNGQNANPTDQQPESIQNQPNLQGTKQTSSCANDKKVGTPRDYFLPFFLGILEMLAYPPLIVTGQYVFIGAWLAFKTVNRWNYSPKEIVASRGLYNRYLLANAVVLVGSYLSARLAF